MKALDLPLGKISRLMIVLSSKSISFLSKNDFKLYLLIRNSPSITHFFLSSFKLDRSALFPKINAKPPKRIDFPAPVSPVIIEKPSEKFTNKLSIRAKFFMESDVSINFCFS